MAENDAPKKENSTAIAEAVLKTGVTGDVTIKVLHGKAEQTFEKEPLVIKEEGILSNPSEYVAQRPTQIDMDKSIAIVEKNKGRITLKVDATDPYAATIIGQMKVDEKFRELGINGEKSYSPEQLAKVLKFKRTLFPSLDDHSRIIRELRNVKANVNSEIEKEKDDRANETELFRRTVESNIPDAFQLEMPVVEGGEKVFFEVQIILEAKDRSIHCYLESVDAADKIELFFEQSVEEQVNILKENVTILHQ